METEMTSALEGESLAKVKRRSALGRLANTEDVAKVVGFLLGDGGRNITGQSIVVDAGNSA
jgi:3-oxoacyl-[acyl-carrier protein] reductase